jgi:hypothetical protein
MVAGTRGNTQNDPVYAPALTRVGLLTAHPAAFVIVLCYVVAWLVFSFNSLDWHAVATIATWI